MYVSRVLIVAAVAALLSACAGFQAIKPDAPVVVANRIAVSPQVMWAKPTGSGISDAVWTIDGFGLNELHFLMGKKPGDRLFNIRGDEKKGVVRVPVESLFKDKGEDVVWVFDDGKPARTRIDPGLVSLEWVEVLKGVDAGRKIALESPSAFLDEQKEKEKERRRH